MATSPRNNPAGLYLRLPLLREQDPAEDMPLRVLVKSLVHQQRLVENYRQRRSHRPLSRC